MADNIDRLISKYHMTRSEASSLMNALPGLSTSGIDMARAEIILPIALNIKRTRTYVKDEEVKPVTWGMAFHLAERERGMSGLIGKKRNLPTDRQDTQFIEKKFTGGIKNMEKQFAPVYKHLTSAQGNEVVSYKEEPTKYYYFDEDDKYNHQGYDKPPQNNFTPYLEVKMIHKVGASKYSKPVSVMIGDKEIIDWKKQSGVKEYRIQYMMGNEIVHSGLVEIPVERNVEFNMYKMKVFKNYLLNELNKFMSEYNEILKQMKKKKVVIALTPEEERQKKSDEMYEKYYGNLLEERKRKRNKIKSKRKKATKIVPKKRCVCNLKQRRIIKKITPKKRRRR